MKLTHTTLLTLAGILGYEEISKDGVCYGFSTMLVTAFLIEKEAEFFARLQLIESYHDELRWLKDDIYSVRKKIKQKRARNEKEKRLLEIPAFFEGILLSQRPSKHRALFNDRYVNHNDIQSIYPLTAPFS